jgi:hypothetical protein
MRFCLLAWGVTALYRVTHLGSRARFALASGEAATYFFLSAILFALFYVEFKWVPRVLKLPLNPDLGKAQAWTSVALLLFGGVMSLMNASLPLTDDEFRWFLALVGEVLFIINVLLAMKQAGGIPSAKPSVSPVNRGSSATARPARKQEAARSAAPQRSALHEWLYPTTPVRQFGAMAIFLTVGGLVMNVALPGRLPVLWSGTLHWVPAGTLWWIGAPPFAVFAFLYWYFGERQGLQFDKKMSNIHFGFTFFWLVDLVRLVFNWQNMANSRFATAQSSDYAWEGGVILGGCVLLFCFNPRTAPPAVKR